MEAVIPTVVASRVSKVVRPTSSRHTDRCQHGSGRAGWKRRTSRGRFVRPELRQQLDRDVAPGAPHTGNQSPAGVKVLAGTGSVFLRRSG